MKKIMYSSTNGHPELLDFKGALLRGQAPDKGLYVPQEIPMISEDELARFSRMDYPEIALRVMRPYLGDLIPEEDLVAILLDAYDFPVPIEKVYDEK
ncbi:MAG: threonine synthase, partial [Methanothrix sp.]|nr:threonine synthase [Methanothrix sp.]